MARNLKLVQIQNFRAIEDITIDFESNYSVLVGRNGSGKTSILEAINIALSDNTSKFNQIKETDFRSDEPIIIKVILDSYFYFGIDVGGYTRLVPCIGYTKVINRRIRSEKSSFFSPEYTIKYDYILDDYNPERSEFTEIYNNLKDSLGSKYLVKSLNKVIGSVDEYEITTATATTAPMTLRLHEITYSPKFLFPSVFYFDKNRERELVSGYSTVYTKITQELNWRYKKKLKDEQFQNEMFESFNNINKNISSKVLRESEIIGKVKTILESKFKGFGGDADEIRFYFNERLNPYSSAELSVLSPQDVQIPIGNLGSGITTLYSLIILNYLASIAPDSTIVLIDEPELHLHSKLQRELSNYIQEESSDSQYIISTHSGTFLNKSSLKSNFAMYIDDNQVEVLSCSPIDIMELQFSNLGMDINDIVIPDTIILLEGNHDKNLVSKGLFLLEESAYSNQLLECTGWTLVRAKATLYQDNLTTIFKGKKLGLKSDKTRIVVDSDVEVSKIEGWKRDFGIADDDIKHLDKPGIEYYYPPSLVISFVTSCNTMLEGGVELVSKGFAEVIDTILHDDKIKAGEGLQVEGYISKTRLNTYVCENLTKEIIELPEGEGLRDILNWITG